MKKIDIFLSYCRKDSGIAENIYNYFKNNQIIKLHRDVFDIKKWDSIRAYMQSIVNMDYTIIIISDAYLKSVNCMYEVLEIMRDRRYRNRIFPAVVYSEIYSPFTKVKYVKYWQDEVVKLKKSLKGIDIQNLGNLNVDLKCRQDISSNIAEFLDVVSDMNNPNIEDVCARIQEKLKEKGLIADKQIESKNRKNRIKKLDKRIVVVGVGGAGTNIIRGMIKENIEGVEFIGIDADKETLQLCKAHKQIQIGEKLTNGHGIGLKAEFGKMAAEENAKEIGDALKEADMVFVTCGMGGGTGTGAAPIVAKIAKNMGILTVGVVTKPLRFESNTRNRNFIDGIEKMKNSVDTLIVISNDKLLELMNENTTLPEVLGKVDKTLIQVIREITNIVKADCSIRADFEDIQMVLKDKGMGYIGIGKGEGESSVYEAVAKATENSLVSIPISGAKFIIIMVTGDISVIKAYDAVAYIQEYIGKDVKIFINVVRTKDDSNICSVAVIATGIECDNPYANQKSDNFSGIFKRHGMFENDGLFGKEKN